MVKTLVTPQNESYNLSIPKNYIGKKIEILFYAVDEIADIKPAKKSMKDFWGILSDDSALDLQILTEKGRKDWEERLIK